MTDDFMICGRCGEAITTGKRHRCPTPKPHFHRFPPAPGARVVEPLTEEDVRRIVREELARKK